ncbi:MAG: DsbA family protein [Bacteroidota bacterium]
MKAVIIGAGIAGLTQGLLLRELGYEVVLCERTAQPNHRGHAFLMNEEGLKVLQPFLSRAVEPLKTQHVDLFALKRPASEDLIKIQLDAWFCLKRVDLVSYLISLFGHENIVFNCEFDRFEVTKDRIVSALFKNGTRIDGDFFIGADGSRSAVRQALMGPTTFTPVEVKEIVGISDYTPASEYKIFEKIQCHNMGLAFGFIPANDHQSVWFMQYDTRMEPEMDLKDPEQLKAFCIELLKDFPQEVQEVLKANDFNTSYVWNTQDFDLLPSFHKNNAVLIGDAAHLALPFTSAGTTNALCDAAVLTEYLSRGIDLDMAFLKYYQKRAPQIQKHVEQGRTLKKIFLEPEKYSERGFMLPLISDKYATKESTEPKPLVLAYYTDPICSTCWIFQPLLRKLELEYGEFVEIKYHMGGLLPNWEDYSKGAISEPSDAARLWNEMAEKHHLPLDGDIWIEDPLESSYPSSIAFKAAQLQDSDKAVSFLRRMKEMLFVEKKNINHWMHMERAALTSGLDAALLKKDIAGQGLEDFKKDLNQAQELGIHVFPTLLFQVDGFTRFSLRGHQPYERLEEYLHKYLPSINKRKVTLNLEELFERYNQLATTEIEFLLDQEFSQIEQGLAVLEVQGKIQQYTLKNAMYWQKN